MSFNVLNELETLGVIRFESLTGYISKGIINDKIFICIGDKLDVIKEYEKGEFPIGNVMLTSVGEALKSITDSVEIDDYYVMIKQYLVDKGVKFAEEHDYYAEINGDELTIYRRNPVTGKPPVPLQTKNKRKRGTSCENSSFFVFCISIRPASLLARLFHLGNPPFVFFRKLLRPWKQVFKKIQIRIVHMFRNLGQQMRDVVEDIQIVEFAGLHNAVDDGTGFGSVDGVD